MKKPGNSIQERQEFLESIDLECAAKYVSKIKYSDARSNGLLGGTTRIASIVNFLGLGLMVKGVKSKIVVTPTFFDFIEDYNLNEGDIKAILIDHEGYHAREVYESPWVIGSYSLITWLPARIKAEIRALRNEAINFDFRGCSERYRQNVLSTIKECNSKLVELTGKEYHVEGVPLTK